MIVLARIVREPLVHFLLLGLALFLLGRHLEERDRYSRITITKEQVGNLGEQYRMQYGSAPAPLQLEALVEGFLREEIFYREAIRLGLDASDEIVRRRLAQKYEFLQQDLAIPADPTEEQLRAHYRQHLDRYRKPQEVTFTHVYFSPDSRGEEGARAAAEEMASRLNRQKVARAADQGDQFPGSSDFVALPRIEISRVFGQQGLAEEIFNVGTERWSAPLRSGLGWHTVYVSARQPMRQIPFEEVREDVSRDYLDTERTRRNSEAFEKLRKRFKVVRE